MTNLFTYGTLRRGHGNHRLLEDSEFVGEATINAKRRGPINVVQTDGDEIVHGEVYRVDDKTLHRIDRLERYDPTRGESQGGYVRTPVTATLENGEEIEAEVYFVMRNPTKTAR